jgi:hypothetical protein
MVAGAISEPARLYHCGGNVNKWIDLQQQQLPDDILVFLASILLISPAGRARVACRRARCRLRQSNANEEGGSPF